MKRLSLLTAASVFALAACTTAPTDAPEVAEDVAAEVTEVVETEVEEATAEVTEIAAEEAPMVEAVSSADVLASVLDAQPDETKARYDARNPAETLAFFGIEPGMTVAEALPGGGWYSKILIPYLGEEGTLIGAHYPNDLWPRFGFGEEWSAKRVEATANWLTTAEEWGAEGATLASTILTDMPEDASGQVDAVLFIRALHNLNRFSTDADYMDKTLAETFRVLKPGGVVGVVQHRAPEDAPAESAMGQRGYLKESDIIAKFEAAGFTLASKTSLNANAKDMPGAESIVWRLPPSLNGTEEGTPERTAMQAIGESDRMTLKFVKPA